MCDLSERDIIWRIDQTEDHFWGQNHGWNNATDHCLWQGITCDNGSVTSILLTKSNLRTTLPPEIHCLKNLQTLHMNENEITGQIPPEFGLMENLEYLKLNQNLLTGPMPTFVNENLKMLNVALNKLDGMLPIGFGSQLKSLTWLDVADNSLSGTIPESLGTITGLNILALEGNSFCGRIPSSFQKLSKLNFMFLSDNALTGTIPDVFSDTLKKLHLDGNMLTGTIPEAIGNISNLEVLLVDDNKLTGTVPSVICQKNLNKDLFTINNNTGRDGCTSVACPTNSQSKYTDNLQYGFHGVFPCEECPRDFRAPYLGSSMCVTKEQRVHLTSFYIATNGASWTIEHNNWLSNSLPECEWEGISCNSIGHVESIKLPNSNLSGSLPSYLGYLEHLTYLDVGQNSLAGNIPVELSLAPLVHLDISENKLSGDIPRALCHKKGINGNGIEGSDILSCDYTSCPVGTYSSTGIAPCKPCKSASSTTGASHYLGARSCKTKKEAFGEIFLTFLGVGLVIAAFSFVVWYIFKYRSPRNDNRKIIAMPDDLTLRKATSSFANSFEHEEHEGHGLVTASVKLNSIRSNTLPLQITDAVQGSDTSGTSRSDSIHNNSNSRNSHISSRRKKEIWYDLPRI